MGQILQMYHNRDTMIKKSLPNRRAVGKWLQKRRSEAGFTQLELAQKIGINKQLVTAWETGVNPVPIRQVFALHEVLEFNIDELLDFLQKHDPQRAEEFYALAEGFGKYFINMTRNRSRSQEA